jgi:hypothetical protein
MFMAALAQLARYLCSETTKNPNAFSVVSLIAAMDNALLSVPA